MAQKSPAGAPYDPARSSKRDLVFLVTGFGDFESVVGNPASAVASLLNGELRSVSNDWGTTVHLRVIGVGNAPVNFQGDQHRSTHAKDNDVENYVAEIKRNPTTDIGKVPAPQFVANLIEVNHPDVVISLGVDANETMIRVEREAHNVIRLDYGAHSSNAKHAVTASRHDFIDPANARGDQKVEAYLHDGDAFQTLSARLPVSRIIDAIGRKGVRCYDGRDHGKPATESVMWNILQEIDHPRGGSHILRGGFILLPLATNAHPLSKLADCILEACMETAKVIPEGEW